MSGWHCGDQSHSRLSSPATGSACRHRQPARAEGLDQPVLGRDGRARVRDLERRAGAHEVVLHVDDQEGGGGDARSGSSWAARSVRTARSWVPARMLQTSAPNALSGSRRRVVFLPPDAAPARGAQMNSTTSRLDRRRRRAGGATLAARRRCRCRSRSSTATSSCSAPAARWGRRWPAWPSAPRPRRRVYAVARFSDPSVERRLRGARRRDGQGRPPRPHRGRRPAASPQRRPDGGSEVRHVRRAVAHLGDEHAAAGARRGDHGGQSVWSPSRPAASTRSCRSSRAARPRIRR